jgi:uncharacterized membrane protein
MPYWQVESILFLIMALAGMVGGFRAILIDIEQRRWFWMALNVLWVMGAMFGGWFIIAAYSFGPSGV